jgi:[acyl-carrier-protein] S-malonyltransferase
VLRRPDLRVSLAVLFPGQGTQHAAMLPWLDAAGADALMPLVDALGADWRERLADAAWAQRNDVAQPLLTGVCIAAWRVLVPLLPRPAVVAGYSVGELAAFHCAGVFAAGDAMALARRRAELMDASTHGVATGLLALADASPALVERLCRTHRLDVAIRFGPDRVVVGGARSALAAAAVEAARAGATTTTLDLAIASHTPWMADAVQPFAAALAAVPFERPQLALVADHEAGVLRDPGDLRRALASQLAVAIRWDDCMTAVAERGATCVLEMGPGTSLSRLWNARYPALPARSVDEFSTPTAIAGWVADALA